MKKLLFLLVCIANLSYGREVTTLSIDRYYNDIELSPGSELVFKVLLDKGQLYKISVLQKGVDVVVVLEDGDHKKLMEKDSPNGTRGYEEIEYRSPKKSSYFIVVKRLEETTNPSQGKVSVNVKHYTRKDLERRALIQKELQPENAKIVQTVDIDHFWEAYDQLRFCKTYTDSINSFQQLYIDRATDGLIDFIKVRSFSAEGYVNTVRKYPKFFNGIRANTLEVRKAEVTINAIFNKFKEIYPGFKAFKVCFAIGNIGTGGTVSDKFVLIGTEVTTSTNKVDLSEFNNNAYSKFLAGEEDIVQRISNMIAHECVHTQQKQQQDTNTVDCPLLFNCMHEGFCDFIGELIAGGQINKLLHEYGNAHEEELWKEFKNQLCIDNADGWLYNYNSVKDKPADLGYYIGYKIAEEYYRHAPDKKQAVKDIIEIDDPFSFLQKSRYDLKQK